MGLGHETELLDCMTPLVHALDAKLYFTIFTFYSCLFVVNSTLLHTIFN